MRALRILILEDNPFQLMALHQMLNANGVFDVLTAENVESARQSLANRGPIDVAICDLHLEDGDGLELIRHLAETREAQALIILSSLEVELREGAAHMARQQGLHVLGCLLKPASAAILGELLTTYQRRFGRQRPGLPLAQVCELLSLHELQAGAGPGAIGRYCEAFFQPKVSCDGRVQGVEALARWQHPERGMLLPDTFIPVLEYAGLSQALTWHMLEQAIGLSVEVHMDTDRYLPVTVNIAGLMLEQADFAADLGELLRRFHLPAQWLTLEVVDGADCTSEAAQAEGMLRLRMLGCQLSIGDFGVASAGLQRLLELPFSELRIAPRFVSGMAEDSRKRSIVAGVLSMAQGMGLRTVITGIETDEEYRLIQELGDVLVQGRFIAAPMSRVELLPWLKMAGLASAPEHERQPG
ncbi:EAL domain, c-di-GMP-specific phosphodiesterase class I (or its enzymatically inactive variant) [Pseudomonas asplenii]|uniref:EAL domain, c-di-GMP-specific phosphodiesterase class I (Or its enzymatically inactive variant) n=1 Tax=Pseudomonas asplenii TaxID=53407 RepID=A0A1H1NVK8_9PSED|nr:EAL domain-containing response regulator [Pseudomonas asplenii]SDS02987.1 EAL domain, c-di-GMP-specific phosphodiesterase class I (or its enzymatically inactive variant) [Pseudomonas asplenii]